MNENNLENISNETTANIQEEPMATVNKTIEEKTLSSNSKKNKTTIFVCIGVLVVLLIGLAVWYFVFKTPNKNVYETVVQQVFTNVKESLEEAKQNSVEVDYKEDVVFNEGTLQLETDVTELEGINEYSFDYEFGLDMQNKRADLYLAMINENSDNTVLDGAFYIDNDTLYIESQKLFSDLLSTPIDLTMDLPTTTISYDTIIRLVDTTEEAVLKFIRESTITINDAERTIDSETKKVKDHAFVLNSEIFRRLVVEVTNSYMNDASLLSEMASLFQVSEEELKTSLEELQKEENYEGTGEVTLHIYTEGSKNTIVAFTLEADGEEVINGTVNEKDFTAVMEEENTTLTISKTGEEFSINMQDDGNSLVMSYKGISSTQGTLTALAYDKTSDTRLDCTLDISTQKESDTIANLAMDGVLTLEVEGQSVEITLNMQNRMSVNEKELANIDTNSARDASTLTEEESNDILTNLYNILMNEEAILEILGYASGSM